MDPIKNNRAKRIRSWGLLKLMVMMLTVMTCGQITPVSAAQANPCIAMGDQSNSYYSSLNLGYFDSMTQTFTAKQTADLTALDLYLLHDLAGSEVWVDVLSLSAGDLSPGTVIAQASSVIQGTGWRTMNFATPVSLVAGKKYAVKVYQQSGNNLVTMLSVSGKTYTDGIFYVVKDGTTQVSGQENMRLRLYMSKGDPSRATTNLSELLVADTIVSIETDNVNLKYTVMVLPGATSLTLTPKLETPADSFLEINGDPGVSGAPYTFPVNEGINPITFTIKKGDCSEQKTYTVHAIKDTTAPTISWTSTPQPNAAGWNNDDVNVQWSVDDSVSGINPLTIPNDRLVTGEGDNLSVTGTVKDKAGNSATATATIKIDRTAPTISGAVVTQPNAAGWYNDDVTINWTATDALSGIDPASVPSDSVITGEGSNLSAAATVSDRAGNVAGATVNGIKIDRTAPTISGTVVRQPNAAGWYNDDVTINWTVSDGLSGIDPASVPSDSVITGEGSNLSATATLSDQAGNAASATVNGIKTDRTAPVTTISAPVILPNGATRLTLNVVDTLSGVKETFYQIDNGSIQTGNAVDFQTDGSFVLKAWSEDNAGNVEQAQSIQVDVDQSAPDFVTNYPKTGRIGDTTAEVLVKTNESGDVHYVVLANGAAAPNPAQIKAGTDASGNALAANLRGSVAVTANVEEKFNLTGLLRSTKYDVYLATEDQSGNLSPNVKALNFRTPAPPSAYYPVEGVSLNVSSHTFTDGDPGVALRAVIAPVYATNQQVSWSSSNSKVAKVDHNGFVTPVSPGEAVITVTTLDGNKTATAKVKVEKKKEDTLLRLEASKLTFVLKPGQSAEFEVFAIFADGRKEDVTFDEAITFKSKPANLLSVEPGEIKAGKNEGEAIVTATYGEESIDFKVTITSVEIKGLSLSPKNIKLEVDEKRQLVLTATLSNKKNRDVTKSAEWESEDPDVVSVEDGELTAHAPGKTRIIATYGGKRVEMDVEVTDAQEVKRLIANKKVEKMKPGYSKRVKVVAYFADGSKVDVTDQAEWTTSDSQVVVYKDGKITSVAPGKATIQADYRGKTITIQVTVK